MAKKQSRGNCVYCGKEMTKGDLSRHLQSCGQRQEAIAKADTGRGKDEIVYHLQVEDAWNRDFWLHLEMRSSAKLQELDRYLRAIWLECCGHLSEFFVGGAWANKVPMSRRTSQVFVDGGQLTHIYDFGSSEPPY